MSGGGGGGRGGGGRGSSPLKQCEITGAGNRLRLLHMKALVRLAQTVVI